MSLSDGTDLVRATFLLVSEEDRTIGTSYIHLNLWTAIRFVLSDAYTSMSREERLSLLHEGVANATVSAYVEIVFDNSGIYFPSSAFAFHIDFFFPQDSRFPTSLPTLTLRRTIGVKKDEYSLDRKSASKADVMNLLESAGFSKSNPYYIVPQGRVRFHWTWSRVTSDILIGRLLHSRTPKTTNAWPY